MSVGIYNRHEFRNARIGNGWFYFRLAARYWLLRVGPFWIDRFKGAV
jgi:hypothetical protein